MQQSEKRLRKLIREFLEEVNLEEANLNEMSAKGLKKISFEEIQKNFPTFAKILQAKYKQPELASASFAIQGSGSMFGLGTKVPMMVTKGYDDPVVLWQDDSLKYNGSVTLADAVRNAQ